MKLILLLILAFPLMKVQAESFQATVVEVIDGDTIVIEDKKGQKKTYDLAFVDAPELKQNHGKESRDFLIQLSKNKKVTVTVQGKNNHIIIDDFYTGRSINGKVLSGGHAWYIKTGKTENEAYQGLYDLAKRLKRGLWKSPAPKKPWEYRKEEKLKKK